MTSTEIIPPPDQTECRLIAPIWHTAVVLLILAALFGWTAYSRTFSPMARSHGRMAGYLSMLTLEWLLTGLVWWGVRLRGLRLRDLVGGDWPNWKRIFADLLVAAGFLICSNITLAAVGYLLKVGKNQTIRELAPHGRTEVIVYLLLSLTAGICEEIVFRGYLQKQLTAVTRSAVAGLLIQGVIFGVGHGYQGVKLVPVIALYGCLFGWLAHWRRSLRPGIIAHFLQDGIAGLAASHFLK
ncbi:MAG: CPBP family intramembrane metalloprotease [Acidobacteriia bacterium]|nr:CPBP family intramembrane metalloprotease [Terriglobia bacterium]